MQKQQALLNEKIANNEKLAKKNMKNQHINII